MVAANPHTNRPAAEGQPTGPFESLRDYVAALEARGRLLRIPEMDADQFEPTGFAYRLIEEKGFHKAPAFLIERLKINGVWVDGPVLGNAFPGWDGEALAFGAEPWTDDQVEARRNGIALLKDLLDDERRWPSIEPVEIERSAAPCKAQVMRGEAVDLHKFAWLQTNPGDAGPYITAGSVFMEDPELGRNVGTYRCQVKSAKRIGVNSEVGQHAWKFLNRAKEAGRTHVSAAVVLGVDPITFAVGTSKMTQLGEDELNIAGGLRRKPVELVACETSSVLVPAHAEIVIEGEIPTAEMEPEGPYGEVYGYMGLPKPENFFMDVKCITYRERPMILNSFAGITKLTLSLPQNVTNFMNYRERIPGLCDIYRPTETTGVTLLSIRKERAGDGMTAGQIVAEGDLFAKAIIVVDEDTDIHNFTQVFHALGTRWQPHPASELIPVTKGFPLDPSQPKRWTTSKMIIDATRQLPEEGGPEHWPLVSRVILEEQSPATFDLVDKRWQEYWQA
jgi:4-hydroxy-3-polyprenylbenzoate decarboxylase